MKEPEVSSLCFVSLLWSSKWRGEVSLIA